MTVGDVFNRKKSQPINFSDSSSRDSFGRFRTSEPFTIFDSKQINNNHSMFWSEKVTGGATIVYDSDRSCSSMNVTTASGDRAIRQTKEYFQYQPGKSLMMEFTFVLKEAKTGLRKRVGYFDDTNGVYLEQNETDNRLVLRTDTSGTPDDSRYVLQDDWNIDPLNGDGPSSITIDLTKTQIMFIDFQWLGVGRVRVGFVIDGLNYYAHEFLNANILDVVYMRTPVLPLRFEIENVAATASASELCQICGSAMSEGGFNPRGIIVSDGRRSNTKSVGTTLEPVYSIRLKSQFLRANIIPLNFLPIMTSNGYVYFQLLYSADLTGPTWVSVNADSIAEYDISATAFTGGIPIAHGYLIGQGGIISSIANLGIEASEVLKLCADIDGNRDILTLVAQSFSGSETVSGGITWKEVY